MFILICCFCCQPGSPSSRRASRSDASADDPQVLALLGQRSYRLSCCTLTMEDDHIWGSQFRFGASTRGHTDRLFIFVLFSRFWLGAVAFCECRLFESLRLYGRRGLICYFCYKSCRSANGEFKTPDENKTIGYDRRTTQTSALSRSPVLIFVSSRSFT